MMVAKLSYSSFSGWCNKCLFQSAKKVVQKSICIPTICVVPTPNLCIEPEFSVTYEFIISKVKLTIQSVVQKKATQIVILSSYGMSKKKKKKKR